MSHVRVLVVDDQAPFRSAAAAVIASTDGFAFVGSAVDGDSSIVAVVEHQPDLVLMDVNLPGIDGLEATRRIRSLDNAPVVVLLSTYELDEIGEGALRSGAGAYVAKADFDGPTLRRVWDDLRQRTDGQPQQ